MISVGGSILGVPLLLYFVALAYSAHTRSYGNYVGHVVIGTTALAVGLNAYVNSVVHFLKKNVRSKKGVISTLPGIPGPFLGAYIGHLVNGESLLFLLEILMTVVACLMIKGRKSEVKKTDMECKIKCQYLIPIGFAVGLLSGFFGIGGGFLIVPSLMLAGALGITVSVGTSLIAVGTFGIVNASNYALYHEIDLTISILYLFGGITGGMLELK